MRVLESQIEQVGPDQFRASILFTTAQEAAKVTRDDWLGAGPTGNSVADRCVVCLIEARSQRSLQGTEIARRTRANQGTVFRQLGEMSKDSAECVPRLKGWVRKFGWGSYGLSDEALQRLDA